MPSNYTENYQLSQWERADKVLMEDFNADNAKIDAALKAEADARTAETAALSAALSKCGNCRLYMDGYTGTGECGSQHQISHTFPAVPLVLIAWGSSGGSILFAPRGISQLHAIGGSYAIAMRWEGTTVSWYANDQNAQLNAKGVNYRLAALLVADE